MANTPNLAIPEVAASGSNKATVVSTGFVAFDEAVAGTYNLVTTAGGTFTLSSLTDSNGQPSWMNARLKLSGTPGAGFNVVVPLANPKFYAVDNQSGQTATIKGATGASVTVATGVVQLAYCDGTNVLLMALPSSGGSFSLGGDVTGASGANTVVKIQNNAVQSGALGSGQDGYVLAWINGSSLWIPSTFAGDVTGKIGATVVGKLQGAVTLSGAAASGNALVATGSGAASWADVARVNGVTVPASPSATQALVATGSGAATWQYHALDVPCFKQGKPAASDYFNVIMAHTVNFLANFAAGSGATVDVKVAQAVLSALPTTASWVVTINSVAVSGGVLGAATAIGTVTITSGGSITFATTSGTTQSVAAGSVLQFAFPASQDATAADFSCTLGGYR